MSAPDSPWKCFAVSGEIGSGKSSVAKRLARRLGADYHSTGSLQRRLASGRNLSTLEMNLVSEDEPTIDEEIDGFTRQLAETGGEFVIDSRLAWHFLPEALKVFLLVDTNQAAARVLGDQPSRSETERYDGLADAVRDILARQESERRRFQSTYGVDLFRWSNYDLVVETTRISPERTVELILGHRPDERHPTTRLWLSPQSIYPTRSAAEVAGSETEALGAAMRSEGFDADAPIGIVASLRRGLYALDGHRRLSCALELGLDVVPCTLLGQDDDQLPSGATVRELLAERGRSAWLDEWERAHDFRFSARPEADPVERYVSVEESEG